MSPETISKIKDIRDISEKDFRDIQNRTMNRSGDLKKSDKVSGDYHEIIYIIMISKIEYIPWGKVH